MGVAEKFTMERAVRELYTREYPQIWRVIAEFLELCSSDLVPHIPIILLNLEKETL